MSNRRKKNPQILTQVDMNQAVASCGIWMMQMANALEDTDIAYGVLFEQKLADALRMHSFMLHAVCEKFDEIGLEWTIQLPDGIGAMEAPNPFYDPDVGQSPSDEGDYPDSAVGEIPF